MISEIPEISGTEGDRAALSLIVFGYLTENVPNATHYINMSV